MEALGASVTHSIPPRPSLQHKWEKKCYPGTPLTALSLATHTHTRRSDTRSHIPPSPKEGRKFAKFLAIERTEAEKVMLCMMLALEITQ